METLAKKLKKVIEKELKNIDNDLSKKIQRYDSLEKKGFIKSDTYSVRRVDTIGYSKFGYSS